MGLYRLHRKISKNDLIRKHFSRHTFHHRHFISYKYKEEKQANIALYARSKDYHRVLRKYLDTIISEMKISYPDTKFHPIVDTSPLADRFLAYQAGLGFFGKNHCLIHPKYGSYFTIGSILTDLSLPSDSPLTLSCGNCTRCMDVCPGRCLKENKFNPWTCKSYLTQKKEPLTKAEEKIIQKHRSSLDAMNVKNTVPSMKEPHFPPFRKSAKRASPIYPKNN